VTTTINQPGVTEGVAVNPVTSNFYFVNRQVADIWKFSGATDTVLKRLPLAAPAYAVAVDPVNNTVFAAPDAHLIHDVTIFKG
jgi:DNA-binding beta-propeller fold protein YncE